METVQVPKIVIKAIIALFIILVIVAGLYFGNKQIIKEKEIAKNDGIRLGYQQAMYDIAYLIEKDKFVSYIIPTTNQTLTLIQK